MSCSPIKKLSAPEVPAPTAVFTDIRPRELPAVVIAVLFAAPVMEVRIAVPMAFLEMMAVFVPLPPFRHPIVAGAALDEMTAPPHVLTAEEVPIAGRQT